MRKHQHFDTWLQCASTPTLEANLATARNSEERRKIQEELKSRGAGNRDTGTMSLFKENAERPTSNAER